MAKPPFVFSNATQFGDCDSDGDNFEFVFVEKDFEARSTDDDDEDDDVESYDYCEDVCSILSNSLEQEHGDDISLLSDSTDDEITSPVTDLKNSALTVPLILLKDLDEAHEAAKLTRIKDPEGVTDLVTTCSDDERGIEAEERDSLLSSSPQHSVLKEPEKEKAKRREHSHLPTSPFVLNSDNNNDCTGIEDSSSLVLSTKSNEIDTPTLNGNSTPRNRAIIIWSPAKIGTSSSSNEITVTTPCFLLSNFPQKEKTKNEEKQSSGDKNIYKANNANMISSIPVSTSRTSNKKRRKKLKLSKKAPSTEKFQHQAGFATLSSPSQGKFSKKFLKRSGSSSKNQLHVIPSRCTSKTVANIAVSCVIESISSYREELSRQQGNR